MKLDFTKAYNGIHNGPVERHLRHIWYRKTQEEDWRVYRFDRVQFGDQPAATIMSIAVERAVETHSKVTDEKNLPPELVLQDSNKLVLDTYVDDGSTGGSVKDINRMMGNKSKDSQFNSTIPSMAAKVGL